MEDNNRVLGTFSTAISGNGDQHYSTIPVAIFHTNGLITTENKSHSTEYNNFNATNKGSYLLKSDSTIRFYSENNLKNDRETEPEECSRMLNDNSVLNSNQKNTDNFKKFSVDNLLQIANLSNRHATGKRTTK